MYANTIANSMKISGGKDLYSIFKEDNRSSVRENNNKINQESKIENSKNNFIVRRGDVFNVDLGNDAIGSEQAFERPCLIIQNDVGNEKSTTVIIAVLTSKNKNAKNYIPTHVQINKDNFNNLRSDSMALLEQVRTVDKKRLKFKIGRLNDADMNSIDNALDISIHNKRQNNRYYSASQKFETEVFDIYKAKKIAKNIIELERFINKYDNPEVNPVKDTVKTLISELTEYCSKFNKNINLFYNSIVKNYEIKKYKGEVAIG